MRRSNTLGKNIVVRIIFVYSFITVFVTSVHFYLEYYNLRKNTISDIVNLKYMVSDSVTEALWSYNDSVLQSIIDGMVKSSFISGVIIENISSDTAISSGKTSFGKNQPSQVEEFEGYKISIYEDISDSFLSDLYEYSFYIFDNKDDTKLGQMHVFVLENSIFRRAIDTFILIIANALLKTMILTTIFIFIINKYVSEPLIILINYIESRSKKLPNKMESYRNRDDEIGFLINKIQAYKNKNEQQIQEIEYINGILDDKVKVRTAELEQKNISLLEIQEKVIQQEKLATIGLISAGLNHEVGNALSGVSSSIDRILLKAEKNKLDIESIVMLTSKIKKSITRAYEIIDGLKVASGNQVIELTSVDIRMVLCDVIESISDKLVGIKISQEIDVNVVQASSTLLRQILLNVIKNASEALSDSDKKEIKIYTGLDIKKNVYIAIEDSGEGVPDEFLSSIFDPLFTTKDVGKGTGLGLHISRMESIRMKANLTYIKYPRSTFFLTFGGNGEDSSC